MKIVKIVRTMMVRTTIMRTMLALLCATLASAASSAGGGASQENNWTLESVLKQLDTQAGDFRSLKADLERTKVTVVVNDKSTESGRVLVRRDDKMRIDLTLPDPRTILRDRDHLYIYNPKIKRVEEYDLGKQKSLVDQFLLLGFGTSGKALNSSYTVTLQGEQTLENRKVVLLELIPKSADVRKQISRIELWIDESTWLPAQQKFYETGSGDYFTVQYKNITRNVKIDDSEFKPHWPRGVTRVKPQG